MGDDLKTLKAALILTLIAVTSVGCVRDSSAACGFSASSIKVEAEQVSPGGTFEVRGENFVELVECDDAGFANETEGAKVEPRTNILIMLRQDSKTWELASVDANQKFYFREELRLPDNVVPGQATVLADGNQGIVETPILVVD